MTMDYDSDIPIDDSDSEQEDMKDEFLTISTLEQKMKETISEVQDILEVPSGMCRILLHKHSWNKGILLEKFYEHSDTNAFLKAAQVIPENSSGSDIPTMGECDICCDLAELSGLTCDHKACSACWCSYLTEKIADGGASEIQCMAIGCKLLAEDEKVLSYIDDPNVISSYHRLVLNSYVETNRMLKWCPGVNCGRAVMINNLEPHPINCSCGACFCFFCSTDFHEPINCRLLKVWLKRCEGDSETYNWISANTKDCPKCFTPIEKNGGCNRIMCRSASCKYQFCWQCMRDWDVHGYSACNSYEPQDAKTAREKSRVSLERYLFYYNRYVNHQKSLKLEEKLRDAVKNKMEQMQELSMSWVEVQYLKNAVKVLSECRRTMMYTYVFAFYLERDNNALIFETNQKDLEMAVEQLSGFLEEDLLGEDFATLKQKVLDKCRYVEHRRKRLLDHCQEGSEQDTWVYKEDGFPDR